MEREGRKEGLNALCDQEMKCVREGETERSSVVTHIAYVRTNERPLWLARGNNEIKADLSIDRSNAG